MHSAKQKSNVIKKDQLFLEQRKIRGGVGSFNASMIFVLHDMLEHINNTRGQCYM